MLSDQNPMKNPVIAAKALAKTLRQKVSKFEADFRHWSESQNLPLAHTGAGVIWVARKCPDFRVKDQKKAVELTQNMVFIQNVGNSNRTLESYANPRISHYEKAKWRCLVVFMKHSQTIPTELKSVIEDYASPESNWSGVWHYDQLIRFEK